MFFITFCLTISEQVGKQNDFDPMLFKKHENTMVFKCISEKVGKHNDVDPILIKKHENSMFLTLFL